MIKVRVRDRATTPCLGPPCSPGARPPAPSVNRNKRLLVVDLADPGGAGRDRRAGATGRCAGGELQARHHGLPGCPMSRPPRSTRGWFTASVTGFGVARVPGCPATICWPRRSAADERHRHRPGPSGQGRGRGGRRPDRPARRGGVLLRCGPGRGPGGPACRGQPAQHPAVEPGQPGRRAPRRGSSAGAGVMGNRHPSIAPTRLIRTAGPPARARRATTASSARCAPGSACPIWPPTPAPQTNTDRVRNVDALTRLRSVTSSARPPRAVVRHPYPARVPCGLAGTDLAGPL